MKISILGIDPGPTESAYCLIDDSYQIVAADKIKNKCSIKFGKSSEYIGDNDSHV